MINHFRQSYEYNLPGKSPHRDGTLRPIGYGPYPLTVDRSGYDDLDVDGGITSRVAYGFDEHYGRDQFTFNNQSNKIPIGEYLGYRFYVGSDGNTHRTITTPKYPVSGLYARPRGGKAGWGRQNLYGMLRHGSDLKVKSYKRQWDDAAQEYATGYPNYVDVIGGLPSWWQSYYSTGTFPPSSGSKVPNIPPGLSIYGSSLTVNTYPLSSPMLIADHYQPGLIDETTNMSIMGRPIVVPALCRVFVVDNDKASPTKSLLVIVSEAVVVAIFIYLFSY